MSLPFIYPLGRGTAWANNELRYSLRSICQFFDVSEVCIISDHYPVYLQEVKQIHVRDAYGIKQKNVIFKIMKACEVYPDGFVLMNDDFFCLKSNDIPYYYSGKLSEKYYPEVQNAVWQNSMKLADEWLRKRGRPTLNFTVHYPYIIQDTKLMTELCMMLLKEKRAVSLRSLYINSLTGIKKQEVQGDCKAQVKMTTEHFNQYIADREWFSVSDTFLQKGGKEHISKLYPQKSIFEK